MNTSELLCCIQCEPVLKQNHVNVYAANRIPKCIRQGAFIVNTDADSKPGTHWCAMYFTGDGQMEYWDSYGLPPQNQYFRTAISNNSRSSIYNPIKLQNDSSDVCGQFCLFYLMMRLRGHMLTEIVETFNYYPNNDYFVYKFILEAFPCCTSDYPVTIAQSCHARVYKNSMLVSL